MLDAPDRRARIRFGMFGHRTCVGFGLGILLSVTGATAATIGYAGDSFDDSNPAFAATLSTSGHTFRPVTRFDAAQLSGLDVVWLDGFSAFTFSELNLAAAELDQFLRGGGQLIVQSAGFGGEQIGDYPAGTGLTTDLALDQSVRLRNPWPNPAPFWPTDTQLSGWTDTALAGYYGIEGTSWMGIADTGIGGQWVTIGTAYGEGHVVYTFQDISRMLFEPRSSDAIDLLGALVVPEPTTASLLALSGAFALLRRRR